MSFSLPEPITASLGPDLLPSGVAIEAWARRHSLTCSQSGVEKVPTFQLGVPLGSRTHPILTLQPRPNNPDIPFQKMDKLSGSAFKNLGERMWAVARLNDALPETDHPDPGSAARKMYKIKWERFSDPQFGAGLFAALDLLLERIRRGG